MSTSNAWRLDREADGIACLTLDRPGSSANSLSRAVLLELGELLRSLQTDPPRGLIVRSGKASGFIAGADVREFTQFRSEADEHSSWETHASTDYVDWTKATRVRLHL